MNLHRGLYTLELDLVSTTVAWLMIKDSVDLVQGVVLLVDDVVPGSDGHQVRVVSRGRDGDWPGAASVGVTQLVSQVLQFISAEIVIVPETPVVGRSGGALDTLVWAEVEIILCGVGDVSIHCCSCWNIARPPTLVSVVRAEESGVMSLLHYDEGDAGSVVLFQLHTRLSDRE